MSGFSGQFEIIPRGIASAAASAGLTEDMVLAWVEGEADAESNARVDAAMKADASLASWLHGLRQDRRGLCAMTDVAAPHGLIEAAQRRREMAVIAGLADGDPVIARLPVSRIGVVRKPLLMSRQWRGLAMAAGIALAIGATAYLASKISLPRFGGPSTTNPGPIATHDDDALPDRIAMNDRSSPDVTPESVHANPDETSIARSSAQSGEAEAAPSLAIEQAVALAGERRLAVRVICDDPLRFDERVMQLAQARRLHDGWVVGAKAPVALADAITAARPHSAHAESRYESPLAILFASRHAPVTPRVGAPVGIAAVPESPRSAVYLAEARLDERAFVALLGELGDARGVTVEMQVLDAPWNGQHIPATVDSILWWTGDPANWTPWTTIPIVIEVAP